MIFFLDQNNFLQNMARSLSELPEESNAHVVMNFAENAFMYRSIAVFP